MKTRAYILSVLAGALMLFAWQAVSQTLIPWHRATMRELADTTTAAVPSIRRLAPGNDVYFSRYGLLMAVRIAPDGRDQTAGIGVMLIEQAAVNIVVVAALVWLVAFLVDQSPLGVAKAAALSGFAMILVQEMSMYVWYGFTPQWAAVNIVDQTTGFFLAGLVIGAVIRRMGGIHAVAVPDGQGYRTSGGRATVSR